MQKNHRAEHRLGDQIAAAFAAQTNELRKLSELKSLFAQDKAFALAQEQIQKARDFIGSPGNILGSIHTKHGEIAEHVEVALRNARSALNQEKMTATFEGVGRLDAADYIVGPDLVQAKTINGINNGLRHILEHKATYASFGKENSFYALPKDQYEVIRRVLSGDTSDGLNQKSMDAIQASVQKIEEATQRSFEDAVRPMEVDYAEVQLGKVSETLEKKDEELASQNENKKAEIQEEHTPGLKEGAGVAAKAAAAAAAINLGTGLYKKYRDGKNVFRGQLTKKDWKELGINAGKAGAVGAFSGATLYVLTNYSSLNAPFAGAFVSAAKGVGELALQLANGDITYDSFLDLGLLACAESAMVAMCSMSAQTLIPIPVVGALFGSIAGNFLLTVTKNYFTGLEKDVTAKLKQYEEVLSQANRRILDELKMKFEQLGQLTDAAFRLDLNVQLLDLSLDLARAHGVPEHKLVKSHEDLDYLMTK